MKERKEREREKEKSKKEKEKEKKKNITNQKCPADWVQKVFGPERG